MGAPWKDIPQELTIDGSAPLRVSVVDLPGKPGGKVVLLSTG
jgi:hypothetical protein